MLSPDGAAYVARLVHEGDTLTEAEHLAGMQELGDDDLGVVTFRFGLAHARLLGELQRRTGQARTAPDPAAVRAEFERVAPRKTGRLRRALGRNR